jgi:hypothetical protein
MEVCGWVNMLVFVSQIHQMRDGPTTTLFNIPSNIIEIVTETREFLKSFSA